MLSEGIVEGEGCPSGDATASVIDVRNNYDSVVINSGQKGGSDTDLLSNELECCVGCLVR